MFINKTHILLLALIYPTTWSTQKVSRILNFLGSRIFDFRFFCGVMLILISLTLPTSLAILYVQLFIYMFSYFAWTCSGSSSIFAYSKKWIKKSVPNFLGGTVNKEYYLQVMSNLREAIRQKRPDWWKNKN